MAHPLMPSSRMLIWGIVFGLAALFLANNVSFVGNITRQRA